MLAQLRKKIKPLFSKDFIDYVHYRYNLKFLKKNSSLCRQRLKEEYLKNYPNVDYIFSNLKSPKVILDIGAHYGELTFFFSKIFPNSTIYSFEPTKKSFKYLLKVIKKLNLKNIVPKNLALGEKEGISHLDTSKDSAMNSISAKGEKIIVNTLDGFIKKSKIKNLDFIKCDVEGFEYFVFKGGLESIRKFKPIIFSEIQEKWYTKYGEKSAFDLLVEEGYTGYRYDQHSKKLIKVSEISEKYEDYFFIHRNKK